LILALSVALLVPWKTPWVNIAVLAYAALQAAAAVGLRRVNRWGWRLGLVSGVVGLASGVMVVAGLLVSWAYLRGVYGAFGYGAAVVSLLLAAVAFQLLGLLPALQLRALLRREVRRDLGRARGTRGTIAAMIVVPLLAAASVYLVARLEPVEPLPASARAQSLAVLRAALDRTDPPPAPALAGLDPGPGKAGGPASGRGAGPGRGGARRGVGAP